MAPHSSKKAQECPRAGPRYPQDGPRDAQDGPKTDKNSSMYRDTSAVLNKSFVDPREPIVLVKKVFLLEGKPDVVVKPVVEQALVVDNDCCFE